MNEKLANALGYVDERYVAHAAKKRRKKKIFLTVAAAVLALVFFWRAPMIPLVISAQAVSLAPESRLGERPDTSSAQWDDWLERRNRNEKLATAALPAIRDFSQECSRDVLDGASGENRVWSPINAYIGLAMLAELTGGHTREQVLDALGVQSAEELQQGIGAIWELAYRNNGFEICTLANSLWLDKSVSFRPEAMEQVSQHYYADIYQGNLGSSKTNRAMGHWLRNQTGGFLKDRTGEVKLNPDSELVLTLLSTIYYQSRWTDKFNSANNTKDIFHSPKGDCTATYMNAREMQSDYYWAEDFGAMRLWLRGGETMWLILPDEDKTVEDVLRSEDYMRMMTAPDAAEHKYMKINLTMPKFDVSSGCELSEALTGLGLGELFSSGSNDFSPSVADELPMYLGDVRQDTRVAVDEEGVTAASYVIFPGCGASEPPTEIIDFVLDRPFVFAITSRENVPMFIGTVQNP